MMSRRSHRSLRIFGVLLPAFAIAAPAIADAAQPASGGAAAQPSTAVQPKTPSATTQPGAPPPQGAAAPGDEALSETARELFEKGVKAWNAGRPDQCRALLLAAWAIKKHPQVALNLGTCELKLGLYRDAAEHLGYVLREMPADAPADRRAEALKRYIDATAHVVRLRITTNPPDAEVLLDGKSLGRGPLPEDLYLEPGPRVLEARAEGRETKRVTLGGAAASLEKVSFDLPPVGSPAEAGMAGTPSAAAGNAGTPGARGQASGREAPQAGARGVDAAPAASIEHPWMPVVIGGLSLGGIGLVAGIALHAASSGAASDADVMLTELRAAGVRCTSPPQAGPCTELLDRREQADSLANAGTVMLVGGVVALAGTGGYVLWSHLQAKSAEEKPVRSLRVAPALGVAGGGMWVHGRF
jgi:hypothetical protein